MLKGFVVFLWLFAGISTKSPTIVFDSVNKDLGKITQGEVARQVFSFSNKGSSILEIIGIETS
jgi:hypothetical protein